MSVDNCSDLWNAIVCLFQIKFRAYGGGSPGSAEVHSVSWSPGRCDSSGNTLNHVIQMYACSIILLLFVSDGLDQVYANENCGININNCGERAVYIHVSMNVTLFHQATHVGYN